jgi:palmitoyl-protein thioesterase
MALLCCFVLVVLLPLTRATLPVVLWHGMGDEANSSGMRWIEDLIRNHTSNDVFVHSVSIGKTALEDAADSFFTNAWEQVRIACAQLQAIPQLANGFNAIGFSQGAQFLRVLVQQCNSSKVNHLIGMGAQHQGVYGMPKCIAKQSWICKEVRRLLDDVGVYSSFVQHHLAQADYWHDADDEKRYFSENLWLPNVNEQADAAQKQNLLGIGGKFVMVKFLNDTMVQPRESSHFGWYAQGSTSVVVPLNETALYTSPKDPLGLRQLDSEGRLVFLSTLGDHLQFSDEYFIEAIVKPFLR